MNTVAKTDAPLDTVRTHILFFENEEIYTKGACSQSRVQVAGTSRGYDNY
jgi:hypothetical protein